MGYFSEQLITQTEPAPVVEIPEFYESADEKDDGYSIPGETGHISDAEKRQMIEDLEFQLRKLKQRIGAKKLEIDTIYRTHHGSNLETAHEEEAQVQKYIDKLVYKSTLLNKR